VECNGAFQFRGKPFPLDQPDPFRMANITEGLSQAETDILLTKPDRGVGNGARGLSPVSFWLTRAFFWLQIPHLGAFLETGLRISSQASSKTPCLTSKLNLTFPNQFLNVGKKSQIAMGSGKLKLSIEDVTQINGP